MLFFTTLFLSFCFHSIKHWIQMLYAPLKPYTSNTLISKSPDGHNGGLLNVWHRSVLPYRIFSSIQMACPSLKSLNKIIISHSDEFNWISSYPPPIVIIFESAAMNNSEPCPRPLSPSIPTQGYRARSGYSENKNVSPVPKYACRWPLSSFKFRSNQREEQYAPNTWDEFYQSKFVYKSWMYETERACITDFVIPNEHLIES